MIKYWSCLLECLRGVAILFIVTAAMSVGAAGNEKSNQYAEKVTSSYALTSAPAINVYAFSMLAPGTGSEPIIYARVVINALDQSCPTLTGDDDVAINTRIRPANPIQGAAIISVANFPITVCEAVISPGIAYTNTALGIQLSAVNLQPKLVQVYGDSGCKDEDCPNGIASQQFQSLANSGAKLDKDLILHMGDYNYRGTSGHFAVNQKGEDVYAYDAGDVPDPQPSCTYNDVYNSQNSSGSPKPDVWVNWQADFFAASENLLPTAPWVFSRGNHELCSRAGPGWFYLLGPGSSLASAGQEQMQCPNQGQFSSPPVGAADRIDVIPPYMLALDAIQVWVMDSANACDAFAGNPLTKEYTEQYLALDAATSNGTPTWVMSHRPIWGYEGSGPINNMLQTALSNTPEGKFSDAVALSLAGHMHIYESLTFVDSTGKPTGRPPQIVIGNSGVSLGTPPGSGSDPDMDGQIANYDSAQQFGFLRMTVETDGAWAGQVQQADGTEIVSCNSANPELGRIICQ